MYYRERWAAIIRDIAAAILRSDAAAYARIPNLAALAADVFESGAEGKAAFLADLNDEVRRTENSSMAIVEADALLVLTTLDDILLLTLVPLAVAKALQGTPLGILQVSDHKYYQFCPIVGQNCMLIQAPAEEYARRCRQRDIRALESSLDQRLTAALRQICIGGVIVPDTGGGDLGAERALVHLEAARRLLGLTPEVAASHLLVHSDTDRVAWALYHLTCAAELCGQSLPLSQLAT